MGNPLRGIAGALRRLARVSPAEWRRMVVAHAALARAEVLMRRRSVGAFVEFVPRGADTAGPRSPAEARKWAHAVARAANHGLVRSRCLARSIALVQLLDRAGLPGARICAGARMEHGQLRAHAWVEYGGEVISDSPEHIAAFEPLTDLKLLRGA
jgi:hypothetical protein